MKDYYKTLGVDKSASKEDIKKAFRKLAHEHHPDKTKDNANSSQKFKEASEAYSVLSDDNKRKQYDTFGQAGAGFNPGAGGFGGAGFNPQDFAGFDFSGFQQSNGGVEFDLGDIFGDFFGGGRRQAQTQRGRDVSIDIQINFIDSIFGIEKDIIVTKTAQCLDCHGTGAESDSGMETCKTCNGKGKINETRRSFIGVFTSAKVCNICHGKGQIPKNKCRTCRGEGILERQQEITVKIPPGIEDGEMVRLGGMGEAVSAGIPGDMYVKVHVKPHSHIRKQGLDLVTDFKIRLTQALMGGTLSLSVLDGEIEIIIPEGTNTGDVLRIRGKGVPNERGKRGDLLVHIAVDMPKKLSKASKQAIEELKKEGL